MPTSKHVPTGLVSKFKAKSDSSKQEPTKMILKDGSIMKIKTKIKKKTKSEQIFSLSKLPVLPSPSYELTEILFQFNDLNVNFQKCLGSKKPKYSNQRKKFRSINGFIAFRSFYSRLVAKPDHQRKLSIMLGKLWSQEPSKPVWDRYASEYNVICHSIDNKLPFVDWLCDTLNLNDPFIVGSETNIVRNYNWKFCSANGDSVVEDIYFTGESPNPFNY